VSDKKIEQLVLGSLLIAVGAWGATVCVRSVYYILRTQSFKTWLTADTTGRIGIAVFLLWTGARAIRRVGHEVPPTRIGWGRLLLTFIYADIRGYFAPGPGTIKPEGIDVITVLFLLVGLALIVAAFWTKKIKPAEMIAEP
jgi:hypothetical protein